MIYTQSPDLVSESPEFRNLCPEFIEGGPDL